jgi:uncharacterized membrane protein
MTANPDKRVSETEADSAVDPAAPAASPEAAPAEPAPAAEAKPEPAAAPAPAPAPPAPEPAPTPAAEAAPELITEPAGSVEVPPPAPEPEPEPQAEPEPAAEGAPDPAAAAPETSPAPEAEPAAEVPMFASSLAEPSRRVRQGRAAPAKAKPAPRPARPRPTPVAAPVPRAEANPDFTPGDFDAVFEARSQGGLGERLTPTVCYLLMAIGPLTLGLSAIPAVVLAYMNRETAPAWIAGHYVYQIRTFWAGAAMAAMAGLTFLFFDRGLLGVLAGTIWAIIMLAGVVWFLLRAVLGLGRLRRGEPIRDTRSWRV